MKYTVIKDVNYSNLFSLFSEDPLRNDESQSLMSLMALITAISRF